MVRCYRHHRMTKRKDPNTKRSRTNDDAFPWVLLSIYLGKNCIIISKRFALILERKLRLFTKYFIVNIILGKLLFSISKLIKLSSAFRRRNFIWICNPIDSSLSQRCLFLWEPYITHHHGALIVDDWKPRLCISYCIGSMIEILIFDEINIATRLYDESSACPEFMRLGFFIYFGLLLEFFALYLHHTKLILISILHFND